MPGQNSQRDGVEASISEGVGTRPPPPPPPYDPVREPVVQERGFRTMIVEEIGRALEAAIPYIVGQTPGSHSKDDARWICGFLKDRGCC